MFGRFVADLIHQLGVIIDSTSWRSWVVRVNGAENRVSDTKCSHSKNIYQVSSITVSMIERNRATTCQLRSASPHLRPPPRVAALPPHKSPSSHSADAASSSAPASESIVFAGVFLCRSGQNDSSFTIFPSLRLQNPASSPRYETRSIASWSVRQRLRRGPRLSGTGPGRGRGSAAQAGQPPARGPGDRRAGGLASQPAPSATGD